jgi:uncharacterized membrane protein
MDFRRVRVICWAALLVFAAFLSTLIPPFQSPDEPAHLGRAYLISTGTFLLEDAKGQDRGGAIDAGLVEYAIPLIENIGRHANGLPPNQPNPVVGWRPASPKLFFSLAGTGYYLPLIYAPQAAGLWLGRLLDLSIQRSYYLTRAITLACCFALLAGAVRLYRPPPLAVALLLLPMSLFQMLSPTIDGVTNALTLFIFALFFSILRGHWDGRRGLASTWLAVCVVVLACSRTHGLPLLALPLYLAWREQSERAWWRAGASVVLTLAWILFAMATTHDTRVALNAPTSGLMLHYASHPFTFVQVVWNSLTDPAISRFYMESFIGNLGWLDTPLPPAGYLLLETGLVLTAAVSFESLQDRKDMQARGLLLVLAVASVALIFFSMLVTWTPYPATVVQGVQGRYFLLPALVLAHAWGTPRASAASSRSLWAVAAFGACSVALFTSTILHRYH